MRIGNSIKVGLAAAAAVLTVQSAGAQTWYAAPAASNSGGASAYWNNKSQDNNAGAGGICNLGAVLQGVATNAQCNNEVPTSLLPLSNVQQLPGTGTRGAFLAGATGGTATSIMFSRGEYRFDLYGKISGFAATTSGAAPHFGYFTFDNAGQRVLTELVLGAGGSSTFYAGSSWGFWIGSYNPSAAPGTYNAYFSDMTSCTVSSTLTGSCATAPATQQWAVFSANVAGAPGVSGGVVQSSPNDQFWVGAEDNASVGACGGCSDFDYQDVVGSFTNLPEPASFALFGTGLVGVLAVGARRKRNK